MIDDLRPDARRAWGESVFAELPDRAARRLLSGAWESRLAAGQVFYRGAHHSEMAMLGVIVDGLVRTFLRGPDGREATIRYSRRGAVVGVPAILLEGATVGVDAQALLDTRVLRLPLGEFRSLAAREAGVAWALARFLAQQVAETQRVLAADVFLDVRSRVASHLLDLAVDEDGALVVPATHQDIADAIGSVREVVSRAMGRMQEERLLERVGSRTVIRNPPGLHDAIGGAPRRQEKEEPSHV
jgi:CRP-like cAMP-binding protein